MTDEFHSCPDGEHDLYESNQMGPGWPLGKAPQWYVACRNCNAEWGRTD